MTMHDRWDRLCARVGAFGSASEADLTYEMISTLYANPSRAYHNLEHIAWCLRAFDEVARLAEHPDACEFALWLHDCVFIPERPDNEARSAEAAAMIAGLLGCDGVFISQVRELILVTKHDSCPVDPDSALVSDVDLAVLGGSEEEYAQYSASIRAEFSFAPEEMFARGRMAFLHRMLDREEIYSTAWYRSTLEKRARANMQRELEGWEDRYGEGEE